ncbi:MAG: tetraacyldisaccharide 4'-kinase [Armatimonadota bacterium]
MLSVASVPYVLGLKANLAIYEWGLRRRQRPALPVASVGNITLGGTGKTTTTRRLARDLLAAGVRPGIVLRGHGRGAGPPLLLVTDGSQQAAPARLAGDEAAMLARTVPGATVAVGKRRERVIARLAAVGAQIAVLDDGFQYFRMQRVVDLVLVDATFDLAGARVFPRGYLREPLTHLRRATHLLLTHCDLAPTAQVERIVALLAHHAPGAPVMLSRHVPAGLYRLDRPEELLNPGELAGRRVAAMCAVGNPASFEGLLLGLGAEVVARCVFPDHHDYSPSDWGLVAKALRGRGVELVIVTEKDAVKLPPAPEVLPPVAVLAVELQVTRNEDAWEALIASVMDAARQEPAA